jgi:hypothetical protein
MKHDQAAYLHCRTSTPLLDRVSQKMSVSLLPGAMLKVYKSVKKQTIFS